MKKTLIILLSIYTCISYAQIGREVPQWRYGMFGNNLGSDYMAATDINQDGVDEMLIVSRRDESWEESEYFYVLAYDSLSQTYNFQWASRIFMEKVNEIFFRDMNGDQYLDVFVGLDNGVLHIFDGQTHRGVKSVVTGLNSIHGLSIADINQDNEDEILVCDENITRIFNDALESVMDIPYGGWKMQIGNIDEDEWLEVVLSCGKALEVHNGNYSIDHEFYPSVYWNKMLLYDIDEDDQQELLYASDSKKVSAYDFYNTSIVWEISTTYYFTSIDAIFNPFRDIHEVVLADAVGRIRIFGASDGVYLRGTDPHSAGVNNCSIGDVDADDELELIWADGGNNTTEDHLFVYSYNNLNEEWVSQHQDGPFVSIDYGDLDNDGQAEYVVASTESNSKHDGGLVNIFNSSDYSLENRFGPIGEELASVKIADIDNDSLNELLVGVESLGASTRTYLYIFNTANYDLDTCLKIEDSRRIIDIEVADINLDGVQEIILGTGSGWSDDECYVFVLSGATKELLWQSDVFGYQLDFTYSLRTANIDDDEALEIVGIHLEKQVWEDDSRIFVIDGQDYSIVYQDQLIYKCLDLYDYDGNGTIDIVSGTEYGEITILDGQTLETLSTFTPDPANITSINVFEQDGLDTPSILFSNGSQLKLMDIEANELLWVSDTINSNLGYFNNMISQDMDGDNIRDVMVGSDHFAWFYKLENMIDYIPPFPWEQTSGFQKEQTNRNISCNFPNPYDRETSINFISESSGMLQVKIFDINGKLVYHRSKNIIKGMNRIHMNLQDLPAGFFSCLLYSGQAVVARSKMIKH